MQKRSLAIPLCRRIINIVLIVVSSQIITAIVNDRSLCQLYIYEAYSDLNYRMKHAARATGAIEKTAFCVSFRRQKTHSSGSSVYPNINLPFPVILSAR